MNRSKWVDLATVEQIHQEVQADICIIGAGAAGIYLTMQLVEQGQSVVLLEAGPTTAVDASAMGFQALFEAAHYPGACAGRFFGMGGSTSRWGGLLVPHTAHDMRNGTASTKIWSTILETITSHLPQVLSNLGYKNGPDFDDFAARQLGQVGSTLRACGLDTYATLALPFRHKNLVGLLGQSTTKGAAPRVFCNAVVSSWIMCQGEKRAARVNRLLAVSSNGNQLSVSARRFVIAAGAIESARILLEVNELAGQNAIRPSAAVGCYLADHLSVPIADVLPEDWGQAAKIFGPRFSGSWMRSFRFLTQNPALNAPRSFAHFIFSNQSKGFAVAKEVLSAIQGRRTPLLAPESVLPALTDLLQLAYGRYASSVLHIPVGTPTHLQLDMEQSPVRENRICLSNSRDAFGRRIASIHWQVTTSDMNNIADLANRFICSWPGAKAGLPELRAKAVCSDGNKPYDAYHPVGTCRMGEDAEAVVDHNLKVWGMQNLWVSTTGVLPSAGTANPTLTLLCLSHQLAEHLQTER
jgi:choline dehydrogenase-like flavoprotein